MFYDVSVVIHLHYSLLHENDYWGIWLIHMLMENLLTFFYVLVTIFYSLPALGEASWDQMLQLML